MICSHIFRRNSCIIPILKYFEGVIRLEEVHVISNRHFASKSSRKATARWDAEHLEYDIEQHAQTVDEEERKFSDLTGRSLTSVWESEELTDEFERSVGRRRMIRRPKSHDASLSLTANKSHSWPSVDDARSSFNPSVIRSHCRAHLNKEKPTPTSPTVGDMDFSTPSANASEELFSYESLKGKGVHYQDLTHTEATRMREAYQQKLLVDRRLRWLKARSLPDPERQVSLVSRREYETEDADIIQNLGLGDGIRAARQVAKMAADAERQELVSRVRSKMREEKLANAKVMKAFQPNVLGCIVDPIKFHVARRVIRLSRLLQSELEEFLTWNSAEVLHGYLGGASVSIHHVEQDTTRSVCRVYFTVTSNHDPDDVERRLNRAAAHLRMQMARRLELGYTPPFRFVVYEDHSHHSRKALFKSATPYPETSRLQNAARRRQIAANAWTAEMNGVR